MSIGNRKVPEDKSVGHDCEREVSEGARWVNEGVEATDDKVEALGDRAEDEDDGEKNADGSPEELAEIPKLEIEVDLTVGAGSWINESGEVRSSQEDSLLENKKSALPLSCSTNCVHTSGVQ